MAKGGNVVMISSPLAVLIFTMHPSVVMTDASIPTLSIMSPHRKLGAEVVFTTFFQ